MEVRSLSFNLELKGGKQYNLPVGGKYCPADIVVDIVGGGGVSLDIAHGPELPGTVVDDQIFVITDTAPTDIYVSTSEPETPASGALWIRIAEAGNSIDITDANPYVRVGLAKVKTYTGAWLDTEAYLGVSGAWVKFSSALPPIGTALENCSWDVIDSISRSGQATDYWQVGDTKSITIGGVSYRVEIIDFNHDDLETGGKAGITFGLASCLNTNYSMNPSAINVGGWGDCALRGTLQGDVFNSLEAGLRGAIKTVKKLASVGNKSETVQAYVDTLFLYSEIEVYGSNTYAVPGEGTQYSIFSDTPSRVKKMNGAAANWWLRSPFKTNNSYFGRVNYEGAVDGAAANAVNAVVFGFCV